MRFVWTIGRLTLIDFSFFRIEDTEEDPDVVVVHHYNNEGDDENDGPDLFGGKGN